LDYPGSGRVFFSVFFPFTVFRSILEDKIPAGRTGMKRWAWMVVLLVAGAPAQAVPRPRLVLVGTTDSRDSLHGTWLALIYTEALRRLGYTLRYVDYPARRASAMSDRGLVDGEIHRVADYGRAHPNLVRVEEPHFAMRFAAYAVPPTHLGPGWGALATTAYRVSFRLGVMKCEQELPAVVAPDRLMRVPSAVLGLRQLAAGHADLFIDVDDVVQAALARPEFHGTPVRRVALLEQVDVHAFLHKKHAALAPRLAAVLAQMKAEGLIERYRQQALAAPVRTPRRPLTAPAPGPARGAPG
jgi:hypothetical protein